MDEDIMCIAVQCLDFKCVPYNFVGIFYFLIFIPIVGI